MSIIRYQPPETVAWSGLNRLSNLRDELDTLFEMPFWSNFGGQSQLFSGWSPALDLYQNNDNVVVRVELPGMRKEDIEISLQDGMLTISGERKSETAEGDKAERTERYVGKFRRSISLPTQVDASKVTAAASVIEDNDAYLLNVEMPGANKEGLEISVENNELRIVGRRSLPEINGTLVHRESRSENFRRVFELDPSIDTSKISAHIEQGILTLRLPKAEQVKPRKITVS